MNLAHAASADQGDIELTGHEASDRTRVIGGSAAAERKLQQPTLMERKF
jgi:hypothetical protein